MSDHDKFVLKEKARQQQVAKQLEAREKALEAREAETKKQHNAGYTNIAMF